jgi:hypothetical protein
MGAGLELFYPFISFGFECHVVKRKVLVEVSGREITELEL